MISEYNLTDEQIDCIRANVNDLKIQSIMFDMDIDYEALSLVEKRRDTTPIWIKRWNEKRRESDNDPASPEQAWA